jgi:thioredoxin-like negative regulator of GroEL
MFERLLVLVALAALIAVSVAVIRAWNARRVGRVLAAANAAPFWATLGAAPDGRPTLVTFSTQSCAACRAAQAPAISLVEQKLGPSELRVIQVDAAQRPDVARVFGVQTVPSTVVLAAAGRVVAVNQGFAPSQRLVEQLQRG